MYYIFRNNSKKKYRNARILCKLPPEAKRGRAESPSSPLQSSCLYLMLPAKFTVMVVAGMAEMSLETVTSPSYMAFTRAL